MHSLTLPVHREHLKVTVPPKGTKRACPADSCFVTESRSFHGLSIPDNRSPWILMLLTPPRKTCADQESHSSKRNQPMTIALCALVTLGNAFKTLSSVQFVTLNSDAVNASKDDMCRPRIIFIIKESPLTIALYALETLGNAFQNLA